MGKTPMAEDISIVLCGEAGQGLQTVERILNTVLKLSGYKVFSTSEFMSRIRGGTNSTEIRISGERVSAYVDRIDILVPFSKDAIAYLGHRISSETVVLSDRRKMEDGDNREFVEIPFSEIASEIGSSIYANTVAVGAIVGILKGEERTLHNHLKQFLSTKGRDVIQKNVKAAKEGYRIGSGLVDSGQIEIDIKKDQQTQHDVLLTGTEAVAFGAVAGGCNFVSFYPMSPSTGVAISLAQHARELGIIVEQAEGEIAAMNMALGAWCAGGRAMVTTSGGGFDLMTEGLSLAGMIESPMVIHLGQRPGGATGFPTRTEQSDLEIALYSGHGEFPRVVLAPGTIEESFYLTQKAFNIADRYQIPVIILTDQYFLDSYYHIGSLDLSRTPIDSCIVKTDKQYKRYAITQDGISSRGIPGFGEGLVVIAGNEHDEEGHLTEDAGLRTKMVNKRLKKLESLQEEVMEPKLLGEKEYRVLVLGWGSTYHAIREALDQLSRNDVAFLHFNQLYPLHSATRNYLETAEKVVVVENNATGQLARHLRFSTGAHIHDRILKYDGRPFSVEEILAGLERVAA
jgi:2-oxoglutarate ferredoxin oxidoreductase subunit alpha